MTIEELLPFLPNHVGGVVIYVSFCFSIRSLIRPVMATAQVFFRGSVLVPYRTSLAVSLIIIIRGEEGGRNSGHKRRRRNKRHSRQSARATHRWYLTIIHYNLLFYVSKGLSAQVNEWVMDEQPDRNLHAITDWLTDWLHCSPLHSSSVGLRRSRLARTRILQAKTCRLSHSECNSLVTADKINS